MRKQQHVKWISIGVMVVMAGYLIHVFMQGWPHMKRGYYAGYYAAKGVVPSEFSDDMDHRFGIRLLPITSSADTVLAGAKRSTLVLKPTYHHYEAFGSEEMFPKSRWSTVIVIVVAILWVLMMVQVFLFLRDIRKGLVFDPVTIRRLLKIAVILMVIPVAAFGFDKINAHTIEEVFAGSAYQVVEKEVFDSTTFVMGVSLFLLVYLLKTGVEIKREADLTI